MGEKNSRTGKKNTAMGIKLGAMGIKNTRTGKKSCASMIEILMDFTNQKKEKKQQCKI